MLIDDRCAPTSARKTSAGIRKAPAKRCAAFSSSTPSHGAMTMCPNSCARLNLLRSDQVLRLTTITRAASRSLRRTLAASPSTLSRSSDKTFIPRSSSNSASCGIGSLPRPQSSRTDRAASSASRTSVTGCGALRGCSHSTLRK